MNVIVGGKGYYTNIEDQELIKKCVGFFSQGCTSYAISFHNLPKMIAFRTIENGHSSYILKDFNFNYKFISIEFKDYSSAKDLIRKGLTLIELV
jgi:hypothetical protein